MVVSRTRSYFTHTATADPAVTKARVELSYQRSTSKCGDGDQSAAAEGRGAHRRAHLPVRRRSRGEQPIDKNKSSAANTHTRASKSGKMQPTVGGADPGHVGDLIDLHSLIKKEKLFVSVSLASPDRC